MSIENFRESESKCVNFLTNECLWVKKDYCIEVLNEDCIWVKIEPAFDYGLRLKSKKGYIK